MKEVRFGLIGLGAMGMAHAKTLLGDVPNARLCAAATATSDGITFYNFTLPVMTLARIVPSTVSSIPLK